MIKEHTFHYFPHKSKSLFFNRGKLERNIDFERWNGIISITHQTRILHRWVYKQPFVMYKIILKMRIISWEPSAFSNVPNKWDKKNINSCNESNSLIFVSPFVQHLVFGHTSYLFGHCVLYYTAIVIIYTFYFSPSFMLLQYSRIDLLWSMLQLSMSFKCSPAVTLILLSIRNNFDHLVLHVFILN